MKNVEVIAALVMLITLIGNLQLYQSNFRNQTFIIKEIMNHYLNQSSRFLQALNIVV